VLTVGTCGWGSGCQTGLEGVEDLFGGSAGHVVAVVAAPVVVADEPGVDFGLELASASTLPARVEPRHRIHRDPHTNPGRGPSVRWADSRDPLDRWQREDYCRWAERHCG
jgi:hypothetical protein